MAAENNHADVLVVGGGIYGLSAGAAFARRGYEVYVLDQQERLHSDPDREADLIPASFGRARLIRRTAFEGDVFADMSKYTIDRFNQIQRETGIPLITDLRTLFIVDKPSKAYEGLTGYAKDRGVSFRELDFREVENEYSWGVPSEPSHPGYYNWGPPHWIGTRPERLVRPPRRPGLRLTADQVGIEELDSAAFNIYALLDILDSEICLKDENLNRKRGQVLFDTHVTGWESNANGVSATTNRGTFTADKLILATGGWTPEVLRSGRGEGVDRNATELMCRGMTHENVDVFYFPYPEGMPRASIFEFAANGSVVDNNATISNTALDSRSPNGRREFWCVPELLPAGSRLYNGTVLQKDTLTLKLGLYYNPKDDGRDIQTRIDDAIDYMSFVFGGGLEEPIDTKRCTVARRIESERPLVGLHPGPDNVGLIVLGAYSAGRYGYVLGEELCAIMHGEQTRFDLHQLSPQDWLDRLVGSERAHGGIGLTEEPRVERKAERPSIMYGGPVTMDDISGGCPAGGTGRGNRNIRHGSTPYMP